MANAMLKSEHTGKTEAVIQELPNERAKKLQDMLSASPDFVEEVERGFEDLEAGRWVWADEVKDCARW